MSLLRGKLWYCSFWTGLVESHTISLLEFFQKFSLPHIRALTFDKKKDRFHWTQILIGRFSIPGNLVRWGIPRIASKPISVGFYSRTEKGKMWEIGSLGSSSMELRLNWHILRPKHSKCRLEYTIETWHCRITAAGKRAWLILGITISPKSERKTNIF